MNQMRSKRGAGWRGIGAVALGLLAVCASGGGVQSPLYVGNIAPVRDEYGREMMGSNRSADAANRSRVEIRTSTDGIIRPPYADGSAHPYNPLLKTNSVGGMGQNVASSDTGLFCLVLADRPGPGTKFFARAFNAPTAAEASFYADSAMVTIPTSSNATSMTVVFCAAKPLDAGDVDGDGLNNSWEKSMGTDDRATADYDGDGMLDLHEMYAGTSGTDPESRLAFRSIQREAGAVPSGAGGAGTKSVRVRWQSVPGRRYQLQFVPTLLGEPIFIPIGETVTAGADQHDIDMLVDVPEETTAGAFRVRLVRD